MIAPLPADETDRLEALRRYRVLDTPPEQAYDDLTRLAARLCDTPVALVTLVDVEREWFKSRLGVDLPETPRDFSFCAHAILEDGPLLSVPDLAADERFADNPLVTGPPFFRSYTGATLRTPDGYALGSLCVLDRQTRRMTPDHEADLRALARLVVDQLELRLVPGMRAHGQALEEANRQLEEANGRLESLATTDGLTGLKNHRAYQEALREQFAQARRGGIAFSLLLLDVDHFKQYNDAFGHPAGDEVLKQMAALLTRTVREGDLVARPGGEEFAVILPQTSSRRALVLAERLRRTINAAPWPLRALTASFGLATYTPLTTGHDQMVAEADAAMYHSKENGRDQVSLFPAQPQLFQSEPSV